MTSTSDRRRMARIHLDSPFAARLEAVKAVVTDISSVGARIEHDQPLPRRRRIPMQFSFEDETVKITCDVIRSKYERREERAVYCSGIRFCEPEDESVLELREMIVRLVERDLDARKAHLLQIRG